MAYTWDFYTTREAQERPCYRGPMIDVELRMSQPFSVMSRLEPLRIRLLNSLVRTPLRAVQTRECVLRALNSDLGPLVQRLYPQRKLLQTRVCEKKDATVIEADLDVLPAEFEKGAQYLIDYGVTQQSIDLLLKALQSANPIVRVSGRCAVVLISSYVELDA